LGNVLSLFFPMHLSFLAAMGFVAVFSGAAATPFACIAMSLELFGYQGIVLISIACFTAYFCSGKYSIYTSQNIGTLKYKFLTNLLSKIKKEI